MRLAMTLLQLLIILVILALMFGTRRLAGIGEDLRSQLHKDLGRMPVYLAETTNGKEAEFIRDRLPKRFPTSIVLVVVVLFGAVAWWLTR
jgi:hypothetical protein